VDGQYLGAGREPVAGDHKYQNAIGLQPSIRVFEEQVFHSAVAVLTHLEIVRWIFEEQRIRLDG
jgi:hypothetical protein